MILNERVPFENLKLPASTMPVSCRVLRLVPKRRKYLKYMSLSVCNSLIALDKFTFSGQTGALVSPNVPSDTIAKRPFS